MLSFSGKENKGELFQASSLPEGRAREGRGHSSREPGRLGSRPGRLAGLVGPCLQRASRWRWERGHGCGGQAGATPAAVLGVEELS